MRLSRHGTAVVDVMDIIAADADGAMVRVGEQLREPHPPWLNRVLNPYRVGSCYVL